jgi:Cu(I)/Ag(I) efflux system membrane protein CusA/SilA
MEKISASSKYCCFTNWGLMFTQLGSEFMPPLDEGSILFMPVTLPDVSNSEIKGQINKIPEVTHVLGKAGRANTATDNSPISMIEPLFC